MSNPTNTRLSLSRGETSTGTVETLHEQRTDRTDWVLADRKWAAKLIPADGNVTAGNSNWRRTFLIVLTLAAGVGLVALVRPEHRFQIVSTHYNFSAAFPDAPTVSTEINDEGLNKQLWTLKRDHGTWAEYFVVSATCYKEALDASKEFDGADSNPVWPPSGLRVLQSGRTQMRALKTSRELPAFIHSTKETATGVVMLHKLILDKHCIIDAGARTERDERAASLFMESVSILK